MGPDLGRPRHQRHPRAAARRTWADRPGPRARDAAHAGVPRARAQADACRSQAGAADASPAAGRCCPLAEQRPDRARDAPLAEQLLERYGVVTRGAVVERGRRAADSPTPTRCSAASRRPAAPAAATSSRGSAPPSSRPAATVDRLRSLQPRRRRCARAAGRRHARRDRPGEPVRRRAAVAGEHAASKHDQSSNAQNAPAPDAAAAATTDADKRGHRPGRKAGALVVLVDGHLVLYVERGGKTTLTFGSDGKANDAAGEAETAAWPRQRHPSRPRCDARSASCGWRRSTAAS